MGRENRRDRRNRERQRQPEVQPLGQIEFPGIMGWMQRNSRILFLVGITFMLLSVGAGAFATGLGSTDEVATPEATETAEPGDTAEATPTEDVINRSYASPPENVLEEGVDYQAVLHLESGDVTIDLLEDEAPNTVNNFVFLAQNRFYDGLTFHRVVEDFVAQAGDPLGSGNGGPGYFLEPESNDLTFEPGVLAMAKSSQGVSGSQFFITTGPPERTAHLNGEFTVFGRVTEGLDVVEGLTLRDPERVDQPRGDVIQSIEIIEE